MRKKTAFPMLILLSFLLPAFPGTVKACNPAPWTFEYAMESEALVYGKVIDSGSDGRKAIVEVISYAGPGQAPRIIHMPETVDDRDQYPAGHSCPDFSMKFNPGEEYVFFLLDIPPKLQLLAPNWITASSVENGEVTVGWPRGEKGSLQQRLQHFAEAKGFTIQIPKKNAQIWGKKTGGEWVVLFIPAALCMLVASACIYLNRRSRKG